MTWEEQRYKINRIIQLLAEITWLKDKMDTCKLSRKNLHNYKYQIRHKDIEIAFYNLDLEGPCSYDQTKIEMSYV